MNALPPLRIKTARETPDAGYQPQDDLRHRAAPGGKMRDSLFWEMIMPDEKVGFQAYLYLSGAGKVGFNVAIWGPDPGELTSVAHTCTVPVERPPETLTVTVCALVAVVDSMIVE